MKTVLLAAFAGLILASAAEAARPDTRAMTCRQARDFVVEHSPVVMTYGYGRGGRLYSMFHASPCRAERDTIDRPAWVPTLDSPSCFIGYTCL